MPSSPPPSSFRIASGCGTPSAGLAGTIAVVTLAFVGLTVFAGRDTTAFWYPVAITILLRAIWDIAADQVSRRERLKIIALALAKRNDLRAIGPLLEAWRPLSLTGRTLRDDDVEHELTRLLPLFLRQRSMDLRTYKKRHLRRKTGRLFPYRRLQRHVVPRSDFTDGRADAVVTVLQLLSRSTAEHDRALLERVSRLAARTPNDVFIRDAAAVCLQRPLSATPVAVPNATISVSHAAPQPSIPSRVILGRKS